MSKTPTWPTDQAAFAALWVAHRLAGAPSDALTRFLAAAPALAGMTAAAQTHTQAMSDEILAAANGVETLLELVAAALTVRQSETVYLLVADYIALNGQVSPEEMRFVEKLGHALKLDRLRRAAFDQAARSRAASLTETDERRA
jgi:hypothetical protein